MGIKETKRQRKISYRLNKLNQLQDKQSRINENFVKTIEELRILTGIHTPL